MSSCPICRSVVKEAFQDANGEWHDPMANHECPKAILIGIDSAESASHFAGDDEKPIWERAALIGSFHSMIEEQRIEDWVEKIHPSERDRS